ncbi:MAG: hypothetical protein Q4F13_11105 [Pseudomonadota bacterium]|nr:hypothetical protein [Pseudomonadota bacterium]
MTNSETMRSGVHAPRAAWLHQRQAAPFHWVSRLAASLLLGSAFLSTGTAMSNPLEVSARIQKQDHQLRVEWTVKNTGSAPLWVMRPPDPQASPPGTQALYLEQGKGGELSFSLKAFALPEGVLASTFEYIHLQELKPGAQLQAAEDVPTPLETHVPYQTSAKKPVPADARAARLCIGFLTQAPNVPPAFKRPDGTLRLPHEQSLAQTQKLACSPAMTW